MVLTEQHLDPMAPILKASHYQPESPEEHVNGLSLLLPIEGRNGFVFVLARTKQSNADTEQLLQILGEQLHRLVTTFGKDANPQHRFEQFLGALNETLASHVRDGRWSVPIEQFHALVGIAVDEQMYLSGSGDLTALFLHKKPSDRFQIFNLTRSIQTGGTLPTWEKTFAVVLDGDLHQGDVFCASNKNLQHDIEPDELHAILTTLPPTGSIDKIRQYFSVKDSVLLIVLRVGEKVADLKEGRAKPLSDVSMEELGYSQSQTSALLEDRKPRVDKLFIWIIEKILRRKIRSRILQDLKKGQSSWKTFVDLANSLGRGILRWSKRIGATSGTFARRLKKRESRKVLFKNVISSTRSIGHSFKGIGKALKRLPRSTKYLVVGSIIGIVILSTSVSLLSKSQARSKILEEYQQRITQIEDLIERAGGAVIYKDENQARSLFFNASNLVDQLPQETSEQQEKARGLKTKIETAMDELRNMVNIPNPALLGDLANVSDGLFGNAMVKSDNDIFVFASDGRVYKLDRTQKLFKPAGTQIENNPLPVNEAYEEDGNIFALSQSTVVNYSIKEQSQTVISLPETKSWKDLIVYANRLYLLEPSNNGEGQIYRFAKTGDGFGSASKWIEAKTTDLNDAVSFTIDGTVFVLKKNGKILRYVSGSEVSWSAGVVDPPITDATDIWTDVTSNFLYVLEASNRRLIVFKKESGEFLVQYRSDSFRELNDFVIDEEGYAMYLLTGSKLYSIAASHVE